MSDENALAWMVVGAWLTAIGVTVFPTVTVWVILATVVIAIFIAALNIGGRLGRVAGRQFATRGDDGG